MTDEPSSSSGTLTASVRCPDDHSSLERVTVTIAMSRRPSISFDATQFRCPNCGGRAYAAPLLRLIEIVHIDGDALTYS